MKERQTAIGVPHNYPDAPVPGARPVYFREQRDLGPSWKHVGWLIPETTGSHQVGRR